DRLEAAAGLRLLDLEPHLVGAPGQCVAVDATEDQRAVLDRHVQLELAGIPALDARDAPHPLARRIRARHEADADRPLDRVGLVELDAAGQLPLDAQPAPVLLETHFDEFVHRPASSLRRVPGVAMSYRGND